MDWGSDRIALVTFLAYSVLAGGNAVGVRLSNQELDPFWGATLRFSLAAVLMLMVMFGLRHPVPRGRALAGAALYGLLAFGGAFAFAFYALVELEAGFGQILLSIVPLVTLMLAVVQRLEKITASAVLGAVLAVAGVAIMSGQTFGDSLPIGSVLAAVGSAVCFAQASITIKQFPNAHPISMNAIGMTVGAVFLVGLTVATDTAVRLPQQAETWWAIAYMVVVGSGIVFSLYVALLERWDASRANYGFVVIPIATVLTSAWLLDEVITTGLLLGGVLVLAGVYLGGSETYRTREHMTTREWTVRPTAISPTSMRARRLNVAKSLVQLYEPSMMATTSLLSRRRIASSPAGRKMPGRRRKQPNDAVFSSGIAMRWRHAISTPHILSAGYAWP